MTAAFHLGPYSVPGRFALSPMAEFTSWPMRVICQEFGAAFACTEMVKARFLAERDEATLRELRRHPDEQLCGGQICGGEKDLLPEAAEMLVRQLGFPFVDWNIACPIRRIVSGGAGAALLADPGQVERCVRAMVRAAAPAPVTIKMRSGLDEAHVTAVEVARAAEAGGAAMIAIHPRTARQGYGGKADHRVVAAVKHAVRIPVIGGGDMRTAADAVRLLRETGCDGVYFGRGCVGDPWIFARSRTLLESGSEPAGPDLGEVLRVLRRHAALLAEHLGERTACLHLRKLSREYARKLPAETGVRFYDAHKQVETLPQARAVWDELLAGEKARN